jgi:hypothetical protein
MFKTAWKLSAMASAAALILFSGSAVAYSIDFTAKDSNGVEKYTYFAGQSINLHATFVHSSNYEDSGVVAWYLKNGCDTSVVRTDSQGWNQDKIYGSGNGYEYYAYDDNYYVTYPASPPCPNLSLKDVITSYSTPGIYKVRFDAFENTQSQYKNAWYYYSVDRTVLKDITIVPVPPSVFLPPIINLILN